jgi:Protein of unknown function (DUF2510)
MTTFVTVSSPSYDAPSLASKLTEKTDDGWTVVAIVPAGSEITAFLSRDQAADVAGASAAAAEPAADSSAGEADEPAADSDEGAAADESPAPAVAVAAAPAEPAGWGAAPETPAPVVVPATPTIDPVPGFEPAPAYQPSPATTPTVVATVPVAAPTPPAPAAPVSSVPAGWYSDPSGRFELRYWDGSQWSEHVSRGGQQFTDAPTA